ncbi:MAG: hypothetical protein IJN97_04935, partial [Oscillospiraceae bacterium]|nr:hypothetical protein [Oscillospiraceae bacterium]
ENAFFMKHTIDDKNILCGTLFGIEKDRRFMFNDSYSLKGDFELSLRYIKSGYNAVRFNGFTCAARHKSSGGCSDARKNGENESRYQELLRKYPELIKASKRTGEIKYVGETKHTQESELYG